jgi:hypothetical protein
MVERYASCRSYEDKGALVLARRLDDGSDVPGSRIGFETAFDRATGGFRFDFTLDGGSSGGNWRGVIWRGTVTPARKWWTLGRGIEDTELPGAICAFSGPSLGTAYHVPSMLLGGMASLFHDLKFHVDGDEVVGGVVCVKLLAWDTDRLVTLWISNDDHALRRVFVRRHDDGGPSEVEHTGLTEAQRKILEAGRREPPRPYTSEITIEYAPIFDRFVSPARFEFNPPPESASSPRPQ